MKIRCRDNLIYNKRVENIEENDIVTLRKAHPCGGREWQVVRIGADIGLVCLTCGHKIFLSRRELGRRIKGEPVKSVSRGVSNQS